MKTSPKIIHFVGFLFVLTGFFASGCATRQAVHVVPLDSVTELMQITSLRGNARNPEISKDGTKLAFESDETGNMEIFISNLAAKDPMQFNFNPSDEGNASWSADGKTIYFDANRLGYRAIFKKDLDNEREVIAVVTRGSDDFAPDISASNKLLVFGNASRGKKSLWTKTILQNAVYSNR